jgi:hypothetical protein
VQVFPAAEFSKLFKAFKQSSEAGGPAYHLATYTVMDNPYQAVHGGWKVLTVTVSSKYAGNNVHFMHAAVAQVLH